MAREAQRRWSIVPSIRTLQEDLPPGVCPFCERPITQKPVGRTQQVCFGADCRTAFNTEYVRWRRLQKADLKQTQRGTPRKALPPHIRSMYEGTPEKI